MGSLNDLEGMYNKHTLLSVTNNRITTPTIFTMLKSALFLIEHTVFQLQTDSEFNGWDR